MYSYYINNEIGLKIYFFKIILQQFILKKQIKGKLPMPNKETLDTKNGYKEFLHLSQVKMK